MISPIKVSQYCLAALTLGCLSAATFSPDNSFQHACNDSQSPSSHRGSGRLVTQVPQQSNPDTIYDYRGTGRLHQNDNSVVSHRGSGRGPASQEPSVAYRGSGRAVANPIAWQEWV